MIARLLNKFAGWALSKNSAGNYAGEDDPRWAYTIEVADKPYLTRVLLSRMLPWLRDRLGVGVYLHQFHAPDHGRWMHNHPWSWGLSIILSGSYDEERLEAVVYLKNGEVDGWAGFRRETLTDKRRVRWFNILTKDDYHSVTKLHGDVWTLFITGPRVQDWGFLVDGEHVQWEEHKARGEREGAPIHRVAGRDS